MRSSAPALVTANLVTLIVALWLDWGPGMLMWPYWIQSVVIGYYARKRMLNLHAFSTSGLTSNGKAVPETVEGKRSAAGFFAFHYGFFHFGYLVFLLGMHSFEAWYDVWLMLACGLSFVLSQRQTYAAQHASDVRGVPNLGTLMFLPYLRIIPMHLGIILGGGVTGGAATLVLFTVLKTGSDVLLDYIDRRIAAKSSPAPATVQPGD
jgi:hypothetical protein